MNQLSKIILLSAFIAGAVLRGQAQTMGPVMQQMQSLVEQTEKEGNVVDDVVYDYIFRDQSFTFVYLYELFNTDSYFLRLIGDNNGNSNYMIRVYKLVNNIWQFASQSGKGSGEAELFYSPDVTGQFKIEISCDMPSANNRSAFGLLIVKKED
jgi:hypothetical protein